MHHSMFRLLSRFSPTHVPPKSSKGFTLTELLVVLIIGSIIVTTLLSLVNELLKTSQRETAKSETQRDMQMSLNYIAADLREAAYVYDPTCHGIAAAATSCPSYTGFIPAELHRPTGAYPRSQAILGFWKVDPLSPEDIQSVEQRTCNTDYATDVLRRECNQVQRQKRSFTLVVYSQQWDQPNDTNTKWKGKSRIIRYQLKKYANLGGPIATQFARKPGYVDPMTDVVGPPIFKTWPFKPSVSGAPDINCQTNPTANAPTGCAIAGALTAGRPSGSGDIQVLSDFLDDALPVDSGGNPVARDLPNPVCPVGSYTMGPRNTNVAANTPQSSQNVEANLASKSFFVCIRGQQLANGTIQQPELGQVQDIVVFLRGNAYGRARFLQDAYLPTLQTTITLRGIINKEPN
jgi:prepilin-type N-terminal cleavage/methylation domain-containing protein